MSTVEKRSVSIRGHRTSYSLEKPFYDDLVAIAKSREMTLAALVASIDAARPAGANLSSALRLYVLDWAKGAANRPEGKKIKNQADNNSS
mgnify:CR=1 FL=1